MATVQFGGFHWAVGESGLFDPLLPGQGHVWAWQPFQATAPVLSLSAHPSQLEADIAVLTCEFVPFSRFAAR